MRVTLVSYSAGRFWMQNEQFVMTIVKQKSLIATDLLMVNATARPSSTLWEMTSFAILKLLLFLMQ